MGMQATRRLRPARCVGATLAPPVGIGWRRQVAWERMAVGRQTPAVRVIDDAVQIRRFVRAGFELENFTVRDAASAVEGIRSATLKPADLVVLDLGLPDMDGADVVERLRSWSQVPIIVLSVRSTEAQKVHLLELGADDYVVKPFGMAELLARVRVALRRQMRAVSGEPTVKAGPLTIDLAARAVLLNDKRLTLTP